MCEAVLECGRRRVARRLRRLLPVAHMRLQELHQPHVFPGVVPLGGVGGLAGQHVALPLERIAVAITELLPF